MAARRGVGALAPVGGAVSLLVGVLLLGGLLLAMNTKVHQPKKARQALEAEVQVTNKKKKKSPQKVKKPKPKRRPRRSRPAPRPNLSSNLRGMGGGVPLFSASDLGGTGDDLLNMDDLGKDVMHDADSVDSKPKPASSNRPPSPPPRAAQKGITGYVRIRMSISAQGEVTRVDIVESSPEDFFDEAVLAAVETWRFEPAMYQGQPVPIQIQQTIRFK